MDRRLVYAGLLVAGAVGLVRAFRGPRIVPGKTRLFLLGDSLAVGLAPVLRTLAKESRVPFDSLAQRGTRIDQWAGSRSGELGARLGQFRPTLILVSLGTNDEYLQASQVRDLVAPSLERLLALLRGTGAEVVWIGPPKLPKRTNGVVPLLKATIARSHYFPSATLSIPRAPDQIHPTARGYAGWAGAIWRWLGAPVVR